MNKVTEQIVKEAKIRMDNAYAEFELDQDNDQLYEDYAKLAEDYNKLKSQLNE